MQKLKILFKNSDIKKITQSNTKTGLLEKKDKIFQMKWYFIDLPNVHSNREYNSRQNRFDDQSSKVIM